MMNKLTFPTAAIALILAAVALIISWKSQKDQVFVDVNKLIDGYARTEIVRAEFEEKATTLRSNVDSLINNWQEDLKEYEKQRSTYSKREKELKQELLSTRQKQVNSYQQAVQKQLQEEDQKVTQTVINDINDFIKEYGKKKGHQIILGATGSGTIMYADEGTDLTDEVLTQLNAQFETD